MIGPQKINQRNTNKILQKNNRHQNQNENFTSANKVYCKTQIRLVGIECWYTRIINKKNKSNS